MDQFSDSLKSAGKFLLRWIEASALAIQWAMYGPFVLAFFVLIVAAPAIAIGYFVWHPSAYGIYVIVAFIVTFGWMFFVRREGNDDDPPVKRGRSLISPGQAKNQAKSRLKR